MVTRYVYTLNLMCFMQKYFMESTTKFCIGRLAPSPTGLLHLGNAWSFLWAFVQMRSQEGKLYLRMEDIDPERSRKEYALAIEEDLRWLGLYWDGEILYQSSQQSAYATALQLLEDNKYIYPCYCTRKELRSMAYAPHVDDAGALYGGKCRHVSVEERAAKDALGQKSCVRLNCSAKECDPIYFNDAVYGEQVYTLESCGGDFALRRSDGVIAYQLAVVVDDAKQGVTHIVRGSDILVSTPRQLYLMELLGYDIPQYAHVPLLLDNEGQRLAKRHASLSLQALRHAGVSAHRVLGLLAYLAGFRESIQDIHALELCKDFSFSTFNTKKQGIRLTDAHIRALKNTE